jgi:hypothetical protein
MYQGTGLTFLLAQALGCPIDIKLDERSSNPIRDVNQPVFPAMATLLLRFGADPNEIAASKDAALGVPAMSIWQLTLYSYYFALQIVGLTGSQQGAWADIAKAMLEYGVDREVKFNQHHYFNLIACGARENESLKSFFVRRFHDIPLLLLINDLLVKKG